MRRDTSVNRRPEVAEDEPFRFRLFCESQGDHLPGVDAPLRDMLLRQQFVGQSGTYRAHYPDARFEIVEHDGKPLGRIVTERSSEALLVVDIAISAEARGRGLGTMLLRKICDEARATGRSVRLSVMGTNAAAHRLYTRLGFVEIATSEIDVTMEWWPTDSPSMVER